MIAYVTSSVYNILLSIFFVIKIRIYIPVADKSVTRIKTAKIPRTRNPGGKSSM